MNLIFDEYIKFLNDNGMDNFIKENKLKLNIIQGFYWLDRQIIKAYDTEGNMHKILRIQVNEDLTVSFKSYPRDKKLWCIESWQETVKRNKKHLLELENESKELILNMIDKYNDKEIVTLSSGGKDSSVVAYLVKLIKSKSRIIFNNTTLDCADTYLHIKKFKNLTIINPKEGFYQWRERYNFIPTRFSRACCTIFKEGAMIENLDKDDKYLFFMGMRNEESNTRSSYGDEWKNDKWGDREWQGILPIRKWTEEDIWLYILLRHININPKYIKGYSRVGCAVACPYYAKSTWVLDKYWYPILYKRWHDILKKNFIDNNKALIMNCTLDEYYNAWNGGIVRSEPTKEVIQEFSDSSNLNYDIAEKYFNHTCEECNKRIKSKEIIAMNMKFLGRNIREFRCKKHLKEYLSNVNGQTFTEEIWNEYIKQFKQQGCDLF